MGHGLARRPGQWQHYLSWYTLSQNDSGLCPVDIKLTITALVNFILWLPERILSKIYVALLRPHIGSITSQWSLTVKQGRYRDVQLWWSLATVGQSLNLTYIHLRKRNKGPCKDSEPRRWLFQGRSRDSGRLWYSQKLKETKSLLWRLPEGVWHGKD